MKPNNSGKMCPVEGTFKFKESWLAWEQVTLAFYRPYAERESVVSRRQ